jgi:hypothetical protein
MNNSLKQINKINMDTNIEQLHSTWIQTMFQMVALSFTIKAFIRLTSKKVTNEYIIIPHIIGFIAIITGIYYLIYTYKIDFKSDINVINRLKNSRIITMIVLLILLFISFIILFI